MMVFPAAEKFIARCAASTANLANIALQKIRSHTNVTACCVLSASGKSLPDLKGVLASHALIHTAEGEFYREAIERACAKWKIAVGRVRERDLEMELLKLPVSTDAARTRITEFGRQVGPPWTRDEKLSAGGAWLMLASLPKRRRRS